MTSPSRHRRQQELADREAATAAFRPPVSVVVGETTRIANALGRELGWLRAASTLAETAVAAPLVARRLRARARSASRTLAPVDALIVGSIALYRASSRWLGRDRALELMRAIIVDSGLRLMDRAFVALPDDSSAFGRLQSFVSAAMRYAADQGLYQLDDLTQTPAKLQFRVTYCRYTELCRLAGAPELASCFCAVDRPFFAQLSRRVSFSCDETLARGHAACSFCFEATE